MELFFCNILKAFIPQLLLGVLMSIYMIFFHWKYSAIYLMRCMWTLRAVYSGDHGSDPIWSPLYLLSTHPIPLLNSRYRLYRSEQDSSVGGYSVLHSSTKICWGILWHFRNIFGSTWYIFIVTGYLSVRYDITKHLYGVHISIQYLVVSSHTYLDAAVTTLVQFKPIGSQDSVSWVRLLWVCHSGARYMVSRCTFYRSFWF